MERMTNTRHYPDHFLVGISDLDRGVSRIAEATGVQPVYGGAHPNIGTHNALISLGRMSYLEIIAPDPAADEPALDPVLKTRFMAPLAGMTALKPFLWAVGSEDLEATARLLEPAGIVLSAPQAGSRQKPDGTTVGWRASFVTGPEIHGLPFFIQWDDSEHSPARTSPSGCRLDRFSITGGDTRLPGEVIEALGLKIEVLPAAAAGMKLVFDSPRGRISL
jgi:hypothetical protein